MEKTIMGVWTHGQITNLMRWIDQQLGKMEAKGFELYNIQILLPDSFYLVLQDWNKAHGVHGDPRLTWAYYRDLSRPGMRWRGTEIIFKAPQLIAHVYVTDWDWMMPKEDFTHSLQLDAATLDNPDQECPTKEQLAARLRIAIDKFDEAYFKLHHDEKQSLVMGWVSGELEQILAQLDPAQASPRATNQ